MRKIKLYVGTGYYGADYEEEIEVPDDTPDSELDEMAQDYLFDCITYGWYEDEDEEGEDE